MLTWKVFHNVNLCTLVMVLVTAILVTVNISQYVIYERKSYWLKWWLGSTSGHLDWYEKCSSKLGHEYIVHETNFYSYEFITKIHNHSHWIIIQSILWIFKSYALYTLSMLCHINHNRIWHLKKYSNFDTRTTVCTSSFVTLYNWLFNVSIGKSKWNDDYRIELTISMH